MEKNNSQHINISGGRGLLSSPLLKDPNFKRSVVLILQKDDSDGHIGLVINHPLDLTLEDICHMPGEAHDMKVYSGGPVDLQRVFWLHTLGELLPGSIEIMPGLYVGGDYETLINAFAAGKHLDGKIRFYLGYSGWSAGQLEKEIDAGAWGVAPQILDPAILIEKRSDEMWTFIARQLGPDYRHWGMLPADPSLN